MTVQRTGEPRRDAGIERLVKAQQPPVAQQDLDRGGARLRRTLPLMAAVVPSTP